MEGVKVGAARGTKADRDRERAAAERHVWSEFQARLEQANTFADARALVGQAPRPNSPGRQFYANLGFFLEQFSVPAGASRQELVLYQDLIRRLDASGGLQPDSAPGILARLQEGIGARFD